MAVLEEEVSSMPENSEIEWSVENEVQLLLALIGHKPVGVSKYFQMACILEKFSLAVHRDDISSKTIWDRLDTMYDMQALEETELVRFPNEQKEFSLPKSQYGALVEQKISVSLPSVSDDSEEEAESLAKIANTKARKDSVKKEEPKKIAEDPKRKALPEKKELRATKRGGKDDDDLPLGSTPAKRSRESSDIEDSSVNIHPSKRGSTANTAPSSNNKMKRPTRLSLGKNSDDVASPPVKRRRN